MRNNECQSSIELLKALADKSRILIVNALNNKSLTGEELSEILKITPSTVSFHLKKLEKGGIVYSKKEQYYTVYTLKKEILNMKLIDLIKTEDIVHQVQEKRLEEYREKVVKAFFEYDKLKSIPVQRKKRKIVLEEIAKGFEKGKVYSEREVNIILADYNDDFCTLRREMVAEKILYRENGEYYLL